MDAQEKIGLLNEAADLIKKEEEAKLKLQMDNVLYSNDDEDDEVFVAPAMQLKRFKVTYETPGQNEKDSDLRIEEDTPSSPIHSRSESEMSESVRGVSQTLFKVNDGFRIDNDTPSPSILKDGNNNNNNVNVGKGNSKILSAIADAETASTERNNDMVTKLDAIIQRLDNKGKQVEKEAGTNSGKFKTLISDAKKIQRQTTAFTTQVIDMANQWDIQRQRIQRLEKDKSNLEDQLKEAKKLIEQLQST